MLCRHTQIRHNLIVLAANYTESLSYLQQLLVCTADTVIGTFFIWTLQCSAFQGAHAVAV